MKIEISSQKSNSEKSTYSWRQVMKNDGVYRAVNPNYEAFFISIDGSVYLAEDDVFRQPVTDWSDELFYLYSGSVNVRFSN